MTHENAVNRNEKIEQFLSETYGSIKSGDLPAAKDRLEQALSMDFENAEISSSLKCVGFWKERQDTLTGIRDGYEKGEYLLSQWKIFLSFLERIGSASERCLYAIRQFVFSEALLHFRKILEETDNRDAELLLRIGKCLKRMGDYEQAIRYLEGAGHQKKEDPEILAELADCYAMINEERASKAFFREAFFLNNGKIELWSLESEMIRRLILKVREMGYDSPVLDEWLPVYGALFGIFTIRRELRSLEYGKLKQAIYALENDIKERKGDPSILTPRLINRYLWLIDHYVGMRDERGKINEVLMKIQKLDSAVYQHYIN